MIKVATKQILDIITSKIFCSLSKIPVRLPTESPILPNINPNPETYSHSSFIQAISVKTVTRNTVKKPKKRYPKIHRIVLALISLDRAIIANGNTSEMRQLIAPHFLLLSPIIPAKTNRIECPGKLKVNACGKVAHWEIKTNSASEA